MPIKYFKLYSDVHMEFAPFEIPVAETDSETLLLLAGDIHVGIRAHEFLARVIPRFAHTIYVLGNHEHYHGSLELTEEKIQELVDKLSPFDGIRDKITIVSNQSKLIEFDTVRIFAGTMWTDLNKDDPMTILALKNYINDFTYINYNGRVLDPIDTSVIFEETINQFTEWFTKPFDGKTIVVTHHAPSDLFIHTRHRGYSNAHELSGGYRSNLEEYILEHEPDYWCCGHTHDSYDGMLGKTRLLNNCRGYPNRKSDMFNPTFENPDFNIDLLVSI